MFAAQLTKTIDRLSRAWTTAVMIHAGCTKDHSSPCPSDDRFLAITYLHGFYLVSAKCLLHERLDLGVDRFCIHRREGFVRPRIRFFVPLRDCLPQRVHLIEFLLRLGEVLVAVVLHLSIIIAVVEVITILQLIGVLFTRFPPLPSRTQDGVAICKRFLCNIWIKAMST